MSKKTYMSYYGLTDSNGQPIGRINYGLAGKPEYTLLGRPVNVCDYLPSFANAENNSIVGFLFNFKDYVLNTNYAMGVKKYEDNDTDDMVTKGIMLADGKVVDKRVKYWGQKTIEVRQALRDWNAGDTKRYGKLE